MSTVPQHIADQARAIMLRADAIATGRNTDPASAALIRDNADTLRGWLEQERRAAADAEHQANGTTIRGLTPLNVAALRETMGDYIADGALIVTATTATFHTTTDPGDVVRAVKRQRCAGQGNAHPAGSLNAVIRKLTPGAPGAQVTR